MTPYDPSMGWGLFLTPVISGPAENHLDLKAR